MTPLTYADAAAWCEAERREAETLVTRAERYAEVLPADTLDRERTVAASAALALRAVRAFEALASGRVRLIEIRSMNRWVATSKDGTQYYAADPLDAITAALGGDDGK